MPFIQANGSHAAAPQTACECGLAAAPTPGNLAIVGVVTAGTIFAVQDTQGNDYRPLKSGNDGAVNLYLYAAAIRSDDGPLDIQAFTTNGAGITMIVAEYAPVAPAAGSIASSTAAIASGTGTAAACNAIAFSGTGLDLGLFSSRSSAGGAVTPGAGYGLVYSIGRTTGNVGLALVAKDGDASGSAAPSATFATPTTWGAIGAAITAPAAILSAATPYGFPPPGPIAARDLAYGFPPAPAGSATTVAVSAVGARWAAQPSFSVDNGTASVAGWDAAGQSATVVVTPATPGVVTLTDSATGATARLRACTFRYVSAAGSDATGAGTQASPWATWTKAVASSSAYDAILGRGGDTFASEPAYPVALAGYRYLGSYGTGPATIAGGAGDSAVAATNCGLSACNLALALDARTATVPDVGVLSVTITDGAAHTDGLVVSGCEISGGPYVGVLLNATTNVAATFAHVTVAGNDIHGVANRGLLLTFPGTPNVGPVGFSDVYVIGNESHDIPGTATIEADGLVVRNCGPAVGPTLVMGNTLHDNGFGVAGNAGFLGATGMYTAFSNGVRIRGNAAYNMTWGATNAKPVDASGLDIDANCDNCVMEFNGSRNNWGPGFDTYTATGHYGNVIRWNLSLDDATRNPGFPQGSIMIKTSSFGAGGATVHGNTVIKTTVVAGANQPGLWVENNGQFMSIYNNIFAVPSGQPAVMIGSTPDAGFLANNSYYQSGAGAFLGKIGGTSYTSGAAWKSAVQATAPGQESASLFAGTLQPTYNGTPPAFTAATLRAAAMLYRLAPGSVGVGAAADLSGAIGVFPGTHDCAGGALPPAPYNIGAVAASGSPWIYRYLARRRGD